MDFATLTRCPKPASTRCSCHTLHSLVAQKRPPAIHWRDDFEQHYSLGGLIGRGSFGSIVLAESCATGERVAVKRMAKRRGKLSVQRTKEKTELEVGVLRELQSCGGVVELLDQFLHKEHYLLVMEYCTGGDLKQIVKVSETTHSRSLRGCSTGYVQGRNGTPVYMAPEVFTRKYSYAADMWSLGMLLFYLITGRFPFWDSEEEALMITLNEVRTCVSQIPITFASSIQEGVSNSCVDFVQSLLVRDSSKRMTLDEAEKHPFLVKNLVVEDNLVILQRSGCDAQSFASSFPEIH